MPTEKWATFSDRGTVLTTELDSLANGSRSAAGTVIDNGSNLDRFAYAELVLGTFGSAPTDKAVCELYMVPARDGTNYADGSSSVRPSDWLWCGSFQVDSATAAKRLLTDVFALPPFKVKFILLNSTGQALNASGNTVSISTGNRAVN